MLERWLGWAVPRATHSCRSCLQTLHPLPRNYLLRTTLFQVAKAGRELLLTHQPFGSGADKSPLARDKRLEKTHEDVVEVSLPHAVRSACACCKMSQSSDETGLSHPSSWASVILDE